MGDIETIMRHEREIEDKLAGSAKKSTGGLCRICEARIDEQGNPQQKLCKKHAKYRESKTLTLHLKETHITQLLRAIDISALDESMDWLIDDMQGFLDCKLDADIAETMKDFKGFE